MALRWAALGAVCLMACGGEDAAPVGASLPACRPPNRAVGDRCLEPGVQDNGCPAGTLGVDRACVPAGVPPEMCPAGFAADRDGCSPILPPAPCGEGEMALPGELECHSPMDCGTGKWGDIPIDANTIFVDASYAGARSTGSADEPFTTLPQAVSAATAGTLIALAAGTYSGSIAVEKSVRIWGRCPSMVELVSSPGQFAIALGTDASELHGVAMRGGGGVLVSGALDVELDGLWVHDGEVAGIQIHDMFGFARAVLARSLVERAYGAGVLVGGSEAVLEGIVLRNNIPTNEGDFGVGLMAVHSVSSELGAEVVLRNSVVESNHEVGGFVRGSHLQVEDSVVRGTLPNGGGLRGRGLQADLEGEARAKLEVRGSVIESNVDAGIYVLGTDAIVEGTTIRGTKPSANGWAAGIAAWPQQSTGVAPTLAVRFSLIESNQLTSMVLSGCDVAIAGALLRDTQPSPITGTGHGLAIQADPGTSAPAGGTVEGTRIDASHGFGLIVYDADVNATGLLIEGTLSSVSDGLFGDGVIGVQQSSVLRLQLSSSVVTRNARAGVSVFGGQATLTSSRIVCNPIALAAESSGGIAAQLVDAGGNQCGCETNEPCKALTTGVAPPSPLEETE